MANLVAAAHTSMPNFRCTKRLPFLGRLEQNGCLRAPSNIYYQFLRQYFIPLSCRTSLPRLRASSEELSADLLEDAKFVPINDDDPQYGPAAILLMGMSYSEAVQEKTFVVFNVDNGVRLVLDRKSVRSENIKVQDFLHEMGGEFLKVLICTEEMIKGTLWDAMNSFQPRLEDIKAAKEVPRICFLSGLTGEEIMMFVDAFPEAKVEPAVFAALVPNNAQKTIEELMEEIMGDHERLSQKS